MDIKGKEAIELLEVLLTQTLNNQAKIMLALSEKCEDNSTKEILNKGISATLGIVGTMNTEMKEISEGK